MWRLRVAAAALTVGAALTLGGCGSASGDASNPCTAPATDYVFLADKGADLVDAGSDMNSTLEENRGAILAARGVRGVPAAEEAFRTYLTAVDSYIADLNGHPFASQWGRSVKQELQRLMPELRDVVEGLLGGQVSFTEFAERGRALVRQGEGALDGFPANCTTTNEDGQTVVTVPR
jgi:hypothetical protein